MIRPIEPNDYQAVLDIYNYYIAKTSITFETEELDIDTFSKRIEGITKIYPWLVYEQDHKIVGYGYLNTFNPRDAYQWVCDLSIYVDKDEVSKGIGQKLYDALEVIAKKMGIIKVVSIITSANKNSIVFHERNGFVMVSDMDKMGYKFNEWYGVKYYLKQIGEPQSSPKPIFKVQ